MPLINNDFFHYSAALTMQDKTLDLYGYDVTVFIPSTKLTQGYENLPQVNSYSKTTTKAFIDFVPKRRIFYRVNWFPEDQDKIVPIYFKSDFPVEAEFIVRTAVIEQVSPAGDLLFKVIKIIDEGKYKVLKRTCFVVPIMDASAYQLFKL